MVNEIKMDVSESTRIVLDRIQKVDPENASRITGYILFQDHGEQEMVKLAVAPDHLIHQVILKVKTKLQQFPNRPVSSPLSPSVNPAQSLTSFSSPVTFRTPPTYWSPQIVAKNMPSGFSDSSSELQNETQFLSLENQIEHVNSGISGFSNDYYYPDAAMSNLSGKGSRNFLSNLESSVKTCHYFNKGFCKHGSSCKFYHDQVIPESFSLMYGNDDNKEDHLFSIVSLEKLESEIVELLKSRRGNPVSIASLPSLYYDTYGKNLQAEGYLTESQRHRKAGYSLTRLIARLKHIKLIDSRPHGQHAVVLKEDLHWYLENRNDKSEPGPIVSGSRQIYLTFPAESTFTEDDVFNYFNTFGHVEDVRIPCQQKRMFGFVTFVSADTVKTILAKGNPHYVCGARVLVKPYREKSKLVLRKYPNRIEPPVLCSPFYSDMESELRSMSLSRGYEKSRLVRKQLMEEQEQALELERRRLAELQLMLKPVNNQSYFGYTTDRLKPSSEDRFNISTAEPFNYLLDAIKSGSTSDDKLMHTETNYTGQDSGQGLDLPDSPFGPSLASGISTVI